MKDKTRKKLLTKKIEALCINKRKVAERGVFFGIEVASVVSTGHTAEVCTAGRFQERADGSDKTMRVSVN